MNNTILREDLWKTGCRKYAVQPKEPKWVSWWMNPRCVFLDLEPRTSSVKAGTRKNR